WIKEANRMLGLPEDAGLTAFVDEGGDNGAFAFLGPRGRARCTPQQLREWRYASGAVLAATGVLCDDLRAAEWRRVARTLLKGRTSLGARCLTLHATIAGKRTTRSAWQLPESWDCAEGSAEPNADVAEEAS